MSAGDSPAVWNSTWSPTDCLGNIPLLMLIYKRKRRENLGSAQCFPKNLFIFFTMLNVILEFPLYNMKIRHLSSSVLTLPKFLPSLPSPFLIHTTE